MIRAYKDDLMIVPVKLWAEDIEEGAMEQIAHLCNLPFAFHHIAIMPDCHQGYGMPVGGVMATKGVIIPNAVGVDIGCGMCAVKSNIKSNQLNKETLQRIFGGSKEFKGGIRSAIPVGFNHHSKAQEVSLMPGGHRLYALDANNSSVPICSSQFNSALHQLGTLGGGNHFIEIQKDTDDNVWIMIHSGSRNLGKQVADHYNDIAIELNKKYHSEVPAKWELAFLPIDSEEGRMYIAEMNYCVKFALANRKLMMDRIMQIIQEEYDRQREVLHIAVEFEPMINIAHNYAAMENHYGENVMVHRKGATLAREGTIGIIPGSQGTKSYIVRGKGNAESFNSCSHGAGRRLSRTKACNELDLAAEIKKLDDQGIMHGIRHKNDLDEASGAYKDIGEVMRNQSDLVDILTELTPIAVMKG